MKPESRRSRFPNYLLIVTNVRLSSGDPAGGIDQLDRLRKECLTRKYGPPDQPKTPRRRGLRDIKIWHRDYLNAAITQNRSIRHAFPALLTAGDILARIEQLTAQHRLPGVIDPERFAKVLADHAQTALGHQRWVYFNEAGKDDDEQSVERVIVNLPARDRHDIRVNALKRILARGDEILRQSVWLGKCHRPTAVHRHQSVRTALAVIESLGDTSGSPAPPLSTFSNQLSRRRKQAGSGCKPLPGADLRGYFDTSLPVRVCKI